VRLHAHAEIGMLGPAVILARGVDLVVFAQGEGSSGTLSDRPQGADP
jgi:hypothetical protein